MVTFPGRFQDIQVVGAPTCATFGLDSAGRRARSACMRPDRHARTSEARLRDINLHSMSVHAHTSNRQYLRIRD